MLQAYPPCLPEMTIQSSHVTQWINLSFYVWFVCFMFDVSNYWILNCWKRCFAFTSNLKKNIVIPKLAIAYLHTKPMHHWPLHQTEMFWLDPVFFMECIIKNQYIQDMKGWLTRLLCFFNKIKMIETKCLNFLSTRWTMYRKCHSLTCVLCVLFFSNEMFRTARSLKMSSYWLTKLLAYCGLDFTYRDERFADWINQSD